MVDRFNDIPLVLGGEKPTMFLTKFSGIAMMAAALIAAPAQTAETPTSPHVPAQCRPSIK